MLLAALKASPKCAPIFVIIRQVWLGVCGTPINDGPETPVVSILCRVAPEPKLQVRLENI